MKRQIAGMTLVWLLCLSGLEAAEAVDENRPAAADARIEFKAVTGQFRIIGGDTGELVIRGTLGSHVEELVIEGDEENWRVEVREKNNHRGRNEETRLEIQVPAGAVVQAAAVSGDLDVSGVEGEGLYLTTVSGDIRVDARPEQLEVGSVSGNMDIQHGGRESNRIKTVSGNLEVRGVAGEAEVRTVSGRVRLVGGTMQTLRAESVSGNLDLTMDPTPRSHIDVQNHSGRTVLALPDGLPLDIQARTFSGRISTDLGGEVQRGNGPGQRLDHRSGDGTVRVRLQSFSGSVDLQRS